MTHRLLSVLLVSLTVVACAPEAVPTRVEPTPLEPTQSAPSALGRRDQALSYDGPLSGFPVTGTFTTSDGRVVPLPTYFHSHATVILGTASVNALEQLQRDNVSYDPLVLGGKGLLSVWLFEHFDDSDLGAYHELAFVHLARPLDGSAILPPWQWNPENGPMFVDQLAKLLRIGSYFYNAMWLDDAASLRAGEEIWAYPKRLANIEHYTQWWTHRRVFDAFDPSTRGEIVTANLLPTPLHVFSLGRGTMSGTSGGSWDGVHGATEFAMAFDSGPVSVRPYWPLHDRLRFGALPVFARLDFAPLAVVDLPDFEFVMDAPVTLE